MRKSLTPNGERVLVKLLTKEGRNQPAEVVSVGQRFDGTPLQCKAGDIVYVDPQAESKHLKFDGVNYNLYLNHSILLIHG
jgi:co-chaperonin GroES (HSP10)